MNAYKQHSSIVSQNSTTKINLKAIAPKLDNKIFNLKNKISVFSNNQRSHSNNTTNNKNGRQLSSSITKKKNFTIEQNCRRGSKDLTKKNSEGVVGSGNVKHIKLSEKRDDVVENSVSMNNIGDSGLQKVYLRKNYSIGDQKTGDSLMKNLTDVSHRKSGFYSTISGNCIVGNAREKTLIFNMKKANLTDLVIIFFVIKNRKIICLVRRGGKLSSRIY